MTDENEILKIIRTDDGYQLLIDEQIIDFTVSGDALEVLYAAAYAYEYTDPPGMMDVLITLRNSETGDHIKVKFSSFIDSIVDMENVQTRAKELAKKESDGKFDDEIEDAVDAEAAGTDDPAQGKLVVTKTPLARDVYMRAEKIFDDDNVDRVLATPIPQLDNQRPYDLLQSGDDGARIVNEWLHQHEADDLPMNSFFVGYLDITDPGINDIEHMFVSVRSVIVEGHNYPIEVALLGQKVDEESLIWSTKISPAESWPGDKILEASPIDLSDAPPVQEAARETWERILRTKMGWVLSDATTHTSAMLNRFLIESGLGFIPKIEVLEMTSQPRTRRYLELSNSLEDPKLEVYRLQRAFWCRDE